MNKLRIIAIILLASGIIMQFVLENDFTDFISGILIGVGIGFLVPIRAVKKEG